ncbi:hypothetical protein FC35_GL001077 [Limosilactobacillus coleohominis DSM 14060]|nr:hypothetical protein FC35_GL001077 [Limosilactobacillus coleohominis DSM 14060]
MKKVGLICITALASLSLVACSNSTAHKSHSKATSSSKVVKHHKKHNKKKTGASSYSTSEQATSSPTTQTNSNQNNTQQSNNQGPSDADIMAEIHRRNTVAQNAREQPYKGYASYYDYKNANPGQPYSESDDPAYTTGAISDNN